MKRRLDRIAISCFLLAACATSIAAMHIDSRLDQRVVDSAQAGDAESEAVHGYVGDGTTVGIAGEQSFRQASGWMRYALKTFEDTPVTVACTFVGTDRTTHSYDVVVEDSVIATRTMDATGMLTVTVDIRVPFALTRGKNNIAVVIRAREGTTPALREIRTVQDHNELQ